MADTNQKQLGNTLWSIADQLRGAMDADDFRDYMLSFLFLRYLSDNYETAAEKELGKDYPFYVCDLSTELWQRIPSNHFGGVTKMVSQVITQRNPAAGFYQRSSSQGILDYSNRKRSRVTEDSSATARSVEHGVFTPRSQGKATVKGSLTVQIEQLRRGTAEESSVVRKVRRSAAGRCFPPLSFIHLHE